MLKMTFVGADEPRFGYWQSEYCRQGLFFLHWKDGVGHLMVPDAQADSIKEMATGKHVLLDITPKPGGVVFTLWFDDSTKTPFYLYIDGNCMGGTFSTEYAKMSLHVHSRHRREKAFKIKEVVMKKTGPHSSGKALASMRW